MFLLAKFGEYSAGNLVIFTWHGDEVALYCINILAVGLYVEFDLTG